MSVTGYDKNPLKHGIVLDLPGYEATGTSIHDVSSGHNNGVFNGTWAQLPTGIWVQELNGTSHFITCGTGPNLAGAQTFNIWLKPLTILTSYFGMGSWGQVELKGAELAIRGTQDIYINLGDGVQSSVDTTSNVTADIWQMLTLTYNGTVGIAYKNAVKCPTTNTKAILISTCNFEIGRYHSMVNAYYYHCQVGKPKALGVCWTPEQIAQVFKAERSLFGV